LNLIAAERDNSGLEWGFHYLRITPESAPLRHGSSLYVQSLHVLNHSTIVDHRAKFARTIAAVANWTGNKAEDVARSYWHRLKPGDRIDVHRDRDRADGTYFQQITRYQIYMPHTPGFVAVMDGQLWNSDDDKLLSGRLIEFNHSDWHYYANHSEQDVDFLVMDFFTNRM
jgi:hypothetical protein